MLTLSFRVGIALAALAVWIVAIVAVVKGGG